MLYNFVKSFYKESRRFTKAFTFILSYLCKEFMLHPDKKYFDLLKEQVSAALRKEFPDAAEKMEDWNGKAIEAFQTDLQKKVKSSVSTKWFYTHVKSASGEKLPRTDVLNLLAEYAGHESWDKFLAAHKIPEPILPEKEESVQVENTDPNVHSFIKEEKTEDHTSAKSGKRKTFATITLVLGLIVMLLISWIIMRKEEKVTYRFCFTDANFKLPLKTKQIEVQVLDEMQSPQIFKCDSSACIELKHKPGKVRFIVKADYCIADTITRIFEKEEGSETIELKTDDYATLISFFSESDADDWEKKKQSLDRMFDDEAEIIQLSEENYRGMEMYNKEEFINKMTMPLSSLKNIVVLNTEYRNKKIISLKFYIREK